jgi:phospholipase/carboxylesterase
MKAAITLLLAFITMTLQSLTKASLHYLVREPKIKTQHPPVVLLLHGVGSNEKDLFSFADAFPHNFLVISARGPLTLGADRYAWFHVDFGSGKPAIKFNEQEDSRKLIATFIGEMKAKYDFDDKKVFLFGFSQGGIMSYTVALTHPGLIKGIAVMSGRLLPEIKPLVADSEKLKDLSIFISHGTEDNVLGIAYAREAKSWLEDKHLKPNYHEYTAGHQIIQPMFQDMLEWLSKTSH